MERRLVEIDKNTKYATEVDPKRLRREAQELKDYLLALPQNEDALNLRGLVLPFCEAALEGRLTLPIRRSERPINTAHLLDVGEELPPGFERLYAKFFVTASGGRVDVEHAVTKDGKLWGWMEFE